MANEGHDIVLMLASTKLSLYAGDRILNLDFTPETVRDIDVKNKEGLTNLVTAFIQNNKLTPAQIFFVLAETVCFSKDFAITDPANLAKVDADAQDFLDAIPFNSVISKIYKTASAERVVGANQELIDTILDAFTRKGFGLSALVPANIYPGHGIEQELTAEFAKTVLGDRQITTVGSMVGPELKEDSHELSATKALGRPTGIRLYILIGVFVLGLTVLGILLFMRK